jgi:hypothetical protein
MAGTFWSCSVLDVVHEAARRLGRDVRIDEHNVIVVDDDD